MLPCLIVCREGSDAAPQPKSSSRAGNPRASGAPKTPSKERLGCSGPVISDPHRKVHLLFSKSCRCIVVVSGIFGQRATAALGHYVHHRLRPDASTAEITELLAPAKRFVSQFSGVTTSDSMLLSSCKERVVLHLSNAAEICVDCTEKTGSEVCSQARRHGRFCVLFARVTRTVRKAKPKAKSAPIAAAKSAPVPSPPPVQKDRPARSVNTFRTSPMAGYGWLSIVPDKLQKASYDGAALALELLEAFDSVL